MKHRVDWWKDFFTGLTIDMWRAAVSKEQTTSEADFIQRQLRLEPAAAILDVPCGFGRLSFELASRGFRLTGVDISRESVEEARANAHKQNLEITYELREMRDLPWRSEFDGVFCFGNSFGYLDDDGNVNFLKAVHSVLKPGARFILDASSVAENILPTIKERTEMQFGDILFKEENHYDHHLGRLDTEYTFVKGETVEQRVGSHRLYTSREYCQLLTGGGFEILDAFGSMSEEPFKVGEHGLYFVTSKK